MAEIRLITAEGSGPGEAEVPDVLVWIVRYRLTPSGYRDTLIYRHYLSGQPVPWGHNDALRSRPHN